MDHLPAIFIPAIGNKTEQYFGNAVKIIGKRGELFYKTRGSTVGRASVFIQCYFDLWNGLIVALSLTQGDHHIPELGLGLFDQAIHTIADVKQDSDLNFSGFWFLDAGSWS